MLKKYKALPWPLNLWSAVFEDEITVETLPPDWEQSLEHVLNSLNSQKRKEILVSFFRDGMTLLEIGTLYGTTGEPVRQQAEKAIRAIRHPSRKIYLFIGMERARAALSGPHSAQTLSVHDNKAIDSLNLSVRTWNCLRRAGIQTIEQLTQYTEQELTAFRNMGVGTLREIKCRLEARGLTLRS